MFEPYVIHWKQNQKHGDVVRSWKLGLLSDVLLAYVDYQALLLLAQLGQALILNSGKWHVGHSSFKAASLKRTWFGETDVGQ